MAGRKGGRPKGKSAATKMVRVREDIADMAGWVGRVEDVPVSELLDPMIRPHLKPRFDAIRPEVERIRRAEEAVAKAEQAARDKARREAAE